MSPLHAPETFVALAEADDPAVRDWATARVALYAPAALKRFPRDGASQDPVLACAAPGTVAALNDALTDGPCDGELASAAAALGAFGIEPVDPSATIEALRAAEPADDEAALWLAHALAQRGAATPADLAAAAKADTPFTPWLLPAVVLTVADSLGALDAAVADVAKQLPADAAPLALTALRTAVVYCPNMGIDEAVHVGATYGSMRVAPTLPPLKGSMRRRMSGAVLALLDGVPGPGPALLRALAEQRDLGALGMWTVATAARLAVFAPGEPFGDVLLYEGGVDGRVLSAARRAMEPDERDALIEAVPDRSDAAVLALEVLDPVLAHEIVQRLKRHPSDLRQRGCAIVAASRHPELVPPLLTEPSGRMVGLELAAWCPTEAVLEALLAMPVPHDEGQRAQYAHALAATGDAAATSHLVALLDVDDGPGVRSGVALLSAILGRPLA